MVLIVALANNQHDIWHTIAATIYYHFLASSHQLVYLVRCQMVGIDAETKSIYWQIELGAILTRQLVFHLSDGIVSIQSVSSHFIVPALVERIY